MHLVGFEICVFSIHPFIQVTYLRHYFSLNFWSTKLMLAINSCHSGLRYVEIYGEVFYLHWICIFYCISMQTYSKTCSIQYWVLNFLQVKDSTYVFPYRNDFRHRFSKVNKSIDKICIIAIQGFKFLLRLPPHHSHCDMSVIFLWLKIRFWNCCRPLQLQCNLIWLSTFTLQPHQVIRSAI